MSRRRARGGGQNRNPMYTRENEEVVEVSEQLKKFVIGKGGHTIKGIMKTSGASVRDCPGNGFLVGGSHQERQSAKEQISQIVDAKQGEDRDQGEVLDIPEEFRGKVIGRERRNLKDIARTTGAVLFVKDRQVYVAGAEEAKEKARQEVDRIIMGLRTSRENEQPEILDIPDEFKGLVIGPFRQTLSEICTRTGARLFVKRDGNVYVAGSEEKKAKARYEVQFIVAGGRSVNPNQPMRSCCFVDNFRLPQDCWLCLVPDQTISTDVVPTIGRQCRLRLSEDGLGNSDTCSTSPTSPHYKEELMDLVNLCLVEMRESIDSGHACNHDMWCHFGTVVIRDAGETIDPMPLKEAAQNLVLTREAREEGNRHPFWRTVFREGVTFDAEGRLGKHLDRPAFATRHDLNFLTPSGRAVRCKVWVRHEDHPDTGGDCDEIPFNDIKNIVGKVDFKNEHTKARCKGWLCLPSTKNLKADIIFPACEFDCRLTLRTSHVFAKAQSDIEEKENKILLDYFSNLELDGENLKLPSEKFPSDFRAIYQRRSKRASHSFTREEGEEFTIIVSREKTVPSVGKETTDLHLHCNKWDKLLRSAEWKPEEIIEKFPSFLTFVSDVQQLILHDQEDQASSEN